MMKNKKILGFFDVVLMTITANFGIRWLAVAAGIGPSSLIFWFIGAILFFLPLTFICAQMSVLYPEEGGIYQWVRHTLGDASGFIVAWLYWASNLFFYPSILIFLVSNFSYFIGRPDLAQKPYYMIPTILIAFWLCNFMSILSLKIRTGVINFGGIVGTLFPALLLIILGAFAFIYFGGSATVFTVHSFISSHNLVNNLSSLTLIMFAMAGIEIIPTFANSVKNVKRDLYFGLLVGSLIILILYVLGTLAMNVIAPPEVIAKASGVMEVFNIFSIKLHIWWFARIMAFLLSIAGLSAAIIWIVAPVIMFFKCSTHGILPAFMYKLDKNGIPVNAIIIQGLGVSIIIILTSLLPSINAMYQVLILATTILNFIPYLFLVIAYIKSVTQLNSNVTMIGILGVALFISVLLGIGVSFVPTPDLKTTHDIILYETELIAGPLIIILLGWWLYTKRDVTKTSLPNNG